MNQEPFDFTAIEGGEPIYISLGTVFNQALEFYKLCLEAFENTRYPIVMSIGHQIRLSDLGEIPENFIVEHYVPQTDVLQYAKLFITHGGMNSVHEGLYNGVPLIVIPQSADQPVIARQVANVGAGITLSMQSLTANELREAADQVLNNLFFKQVAAHMRNSFLESGGYYQAVDEIFKYKSQCNI